MSELNASNFKKEEGGQGPDLCGTTELTSPYFMVPPSGNTEQRPQNPQKGTLRFNTDIGSLEYFKGDTIGWESISRTTPNLNGGARGLVMGGNPGPVQNTISFVTISTLGNTTDFGDLTLARASNTTFSSRTRACCAGGYAPGNRREIDYVTISSTGNAITFGNLLDDNHQYALSGTGDQTRGLVAGGLKLPSPYTSTNRIQYNTIATTGDSLDFGDMTVGRSDLGSCNSSTRSVFIGGQDVPTTPAGVDTIDYVTTQTLGNATDFGNLIAVKTPNDSGCSNSTRGLVFGSRSPANTNVIEYITIATAGNAIDFGDSTFSGSYSFATSNSTRALSFGGSNNVIEYVEILTTGNAVDFGDCHPNQDYTSACSNAHGGL